MYVWAAFEAKLPPTRQDLVTLIPNSSLKFIYLWCAKNDCDFRKNSFPLCGIAFIMNMHTKDENVSGWRVETGPTLKYVLMKKPQPDPIQPEFGPWGPTRPNSTRFGFGRTKLSSKKIKEIDAFFKIFLLVHLSTLFCKKKERKYENKTD